MSWDAPYPEWPLKKPQNPQPMAFEDNSSNDSFQQPTAPQYDVRSPLSELSVGFPAPTEQYTEEQDVPKFDVRAPLSEYSVGFPVPTEQNLNENQQIGAGEPFNPTSGIATEEPMDLASLFKSGAEPAPTVPDVNPRAPGNQFIQEASQQPKTNYIDALSKQILSQGSTDKWTGAGFGSAEANAKDMARILNSIGITDIKQFGLIDKPYDAQVNPDGRGGYVDMQGKPVDPSKVTAQDVSGESGNETVYTAPTTTKVYGNKVTGQEVPMTYSERQTGNAWGGTFQGAGNTGYRVNFDEQGNPLFYTTGASSDNMAQFAPLLAMASLIPGAYPFTQGLNALMAAKSGNVLGAIGGLAGLGDYAGIGNMANVANAANFAGAVKSGNPLAILSSGAGLGGTDLSGLANSAGLNELNNIGGYNVNDVAKAYQTAKALKSGDPTSIISSLGGYAGSAGQPSESNVPFPRDPSDTFSSIQEPLPRNLATKPIESSIGEVSQEIPSINANPYEMPQLPSLPSAPSGLTPSAPSGPTDYSGSSFNDAFARARANGEKTFIWDGRPFTTELKPTPSTPPKDSVGGVRGGQGGMTAEQSNSRYATAPSTNPLARFVNSLIPSAEAGGLPYNAGAGRVVQGGSTAQELSDYESQKNLGPYVGYKNAFNMNPKGGDVNQLPDPRTYAAVSGFMGQSPDQQGFSVLHPNYSDIKSAGEAGFYTGIVADMLPVLGRAGKSTLNYLNRGEDISDIVGNAGRYVPGSNAYQAPEYASNPYRMSADPVRMFKMVNEIPRELWGTSAVQNALEAVGRGDGVAAMRAIESNPLTKKAMLDYANKLGYQEVSPYKQGKLFNPPEYIAPARGLSGGLSENTINRTIGKRAEGGSVAGYAAGGFVNQTSEDADSQDQQDLLAPQQAPTTNTQAPTQASTTPSNAQMKAEIISKIKDQILGQGLTSKWQGQGHGSAEKNAEDMARIMASIGITDIKQFGEVPKYEQATVREGYNGQVAQQDDNGNYYVMSPPDEEGNRSRINVDPSQISKAYGYQDADGNFTTVDPSKVVMKDGAALVETGKTFGNKQTGQEVPLTYSERQIGNAWGGTFAGAGNTGYRVQFGDDGTPYFYTTKASSNDLANLMQDLGPAGQIAMALATGGMTIPQQIAAQMALQVLSGKSIGDAIKTAAVAWAGSEIPGLSGLKDAASFLNGIDPTGVLSTSFQNAAVSGAKAAISGKNIGEGIKNGAIVGGVNGAVNAVLDLDEFKDLTASQKRIAANAITGVISGKPLDQIIINSAIAAANASVAQAKKADETQVTSPYFTPTSTTTAGIEEPPSGLSVATTQPTTSSQQPPSGLQLAGLTPSTTTDGGNGFTMPGVDDKTATMFAGFNDVNKIATGSTTTPNWLKIDSDEEIIGTTKDDEGNKRYIISRANPLDPDKPTVFTVGRDPITGEIDFGWGNGPSDENGVANPYVLIVSSKSPPPRTIELDPTYTNNKSTSIEIPKSSPSQTPPVGGLPTVVTPPTTIIDPPVGTPPPTGVPSTTVPTTGGLPTTVSPPTVVTPTSSTATNTPTTVLNPAVQTSTVGTPTVGRLPTASTPSTGIIPATGTATVGTQTNGKSGIDGKVTGTNGTGTNPVNTSINQPTTSQTSTTSTSQEDPEEDPTTSQTSTTTTPTTATTTGTTGGTSTTRTPTKSVSSQVSGSGLGNLVSKALDSSPQFLKGAPVSKKKLGELMALQQLFGSLTPELQSVFADRGITPPVMEPDSDLPKEMGEEQPTTYVASGGLISSDTQKILDSLIPNYVKSQTHFAAAPVTEQTSRFQMLKHLAEGPLKGAGMRGGLAHGGLPTKYEKAAPKGHNPEFITGLTGYYAQGGGTGQSDDIPAMLHDGDYVMDADTVAALGDGSSKAGAEVLEKMRNSVPQSKSHGGGTPVAAQIADGEYVFPASFVTAIGGGSNALGSKRLNEMREKIRAHKRSAPTTKIPPKAKSPLDYLKMAKG